MNARTRWTDNARSLRRYRNLRWRFVRPSLGEGRVWRGQSRRQYTYPGSLTQLPLQLVQPFPRTSEVFHLGLVMFPEQPHVSFVVHPLGLLRKRLPHVRAAAETLPDLLRPSQGSKRLVLALALVAEVVAVAA